MAIMQDSGRSVKQLLRRDDQIWLQDVLDLIPKSVYGDDLSQAAHIDNSEKAVRKDAKKDYSGKKRKTKRSARKDIADTDDSRHASLKRKLQGKILAKRVARKADEESYIEARAARKRRRDEKSSSGSREGKRMRVDKKHLKEDKQKVTTADSDDTGDRENDQRKDEAEDGSHDSVALETTRVAGFETDKPVRKVKRRKLRGNKLLELQKKLEEANKEKEVVEKGPHTSGAMTNEGEAAIIGGRKREIEKAMQRAQGMDVKDDVKKLKKSIRRERRKTEKSREEWEKRTKMQEREQRAKQEKRARSLDERRAKKGSTGRSGVGKRK